MYVVLLGLKGLKSSLRKASAYKTFCRLDSSKSLQIVSLLYQFSKEKLLCSLEEEPTILDSLLGIENSKEAREINRSFNRKIWLVIGACISKIEVSGVLIIRKGVGRSLKAKSKVSIIEEYE